MLKENKYLILSLSLLPVLFFFSNSSLAADFRIDSNSHIVINCGFAGINSECIIDSGAAVNELPNHPKFRALKSNAKIQFGSVSGRVTCDFIEKTDVYIGDLSVGIHSAVRCPTKGGGFGSYGLLGMNSFKSGTFSFDFKRSEVTQKYPSFLKQIPLRLSSQGHFYLPVMVQEKRIDALWDTGIADGALIDRKFVAAHPEWFKFVGKKRYQDITGSPVDSRVYRFTLDIDGNRIEIEAGAIDFSKLTLFKEDKVPILLGIDVIRKMNWSFDVDSKVWSVEKIQ